MPQTREEWLNAAVDLFRGHFKEAGLHLPRKIKISCGWTSYGAQPARKTYVAAESWPKSVSKDRVNEIFISPKLNNPTEILTFLAHELVHVSLDCEEGHRYEFQRRAKLIGLKSPWVQAHATKELLNTLQEWCKDLGTYPHGGFRHSSAAYGTPSKTYLVKVECPACGYVVRATRKWLDNGGPICPIDREEMI